MQQGSLFHVNNRKKLSRKNNTSATNPLEDVNMASPLANRVRPRTISDFVGQQRLLGKGQLLRKLIANDRIPNMILWGPPGCGKTTLAEIIARHTKATFLQFSAADASIKRIKALMRQAEEYRKMGKKVIVFIDEIHRFNKSQQDAFLPYTEKGSITLIGATTENPSFKINSALLSRCRVFIFHQLTTKDIENLIKHALKSPYGFPKLKIDIDKKEIKLLAESASGDARKALNNLAIAVENGQRKKNHVYITLNDLKQLAGRKFLLYDQKGDQHYDLISALHKSVRNSDVNAAIYWLYRMLDGGEDPLYIARRVVRMSSEDIGLADPSALNMCVSAYLTCKFLGMPECRLALVQAVTRLAIDPKSNALYRAGVAADNDVKESMNLPVPLQIRNAPTKLMSKLGYHENYLYAHNYKYHTTSMRTMPEDLIHHTYYHPSNYGWEKKYFKPRMEWLKNVKQFEKKNGNKKESNFKPM